jgi:hypothetical protein
MGIPGLPQSATGHTSLYTGINAPQLINKHLFGFPNQALRNILQNHSLFVKLVAQGYTCKFMNAFRPIFFTTPEIFKNLRMSATTEMNRYASLPFCDFHQIRKKRALYHEYSNIDLKKMGFDLPQFDAADAAQILISESQKFDLVLYEYFLTDFVGHARDMNRAISEIHKVENLISALIEKINQTTTLIVVSDHGNIEDLRTKSHTQNPAFLGIWGRYPEANWLKFQSLTDLYPFIYFSITGNPA